MKRISFVFIALLASVLTFGRLAAETSTREAAVDRVTGKAVVTLPDGTVKPLTAGMMVAQGSTITTGADGDVYLESHAGYVTAIKADSTVLVEEISVTTEGGKVTAEKTLLDLKGGNLVAKLDPTKKAVNQYAVRTPKGVAAARGTTFTMSYKGAKVTIAVVNGVVSVVAPALFHPNFWSGDIFAGGVNTGSTSQGSMISGNRTVSAGQALQNDQATFAESLGTRSIFDIGSDYGSASALAEANSIKELLSLAVATVAVAAQNGIGGTTPAEAAAVAKAVFAAVPEAAAQSAALMKQSGVTNPAITDAIRAEVPAAQSQSFDSSLRSGTFTQTTGTTTTTNMTSELFDSTTTTTATQTTTTPQPINPTTVSRSD